MIHESLEIQQLNIKLWKLHEVRKQAAAVQIAGSVRITHSRGKGPLHVLGAQKLYVHLPHGATALLEG